jgi:hypothetical protein
MEFHTPLLACQGEKCVDIDYRDLAMALTAEDWLQVPHSHNVGLLR